MTSTRPRWARVARGVVLLVAVQLACLVIYKVVAAGNATPRRAAPFAEPIRGDTIADDLVLERADGTPWAMQALRGRPVLLHFWATWCRPCRDELPTLIANAARIRAAGVHLAIVSVDDDWAAVRAFFGDRVPADLVRARGHGYRRWTTGVVPATLVVDAGGRAAQRIRGARDWSTPAAATFIDALEQDHGR